MRALASHQRLAAQGPFAHLTAFATLRLHAVTGLHALDPANQKLTRWISIEGTPRLTEFRLSAQGVEVGVDSADELVNSQVVAKTNHWFDLGADAVAIDEHLRSDPLFSEQVAKHPGIRITRIHEGFESVILTVLGQQVSLSAGRLFAERLITGLGTPAPPAPYCPQLSLFPSPAAIAAQSLEDLRSLIGLTRSRARTVLEVADLFASRALPLDVLPDRATLGGVHGIGPWTLDYLALRSGTDPDVFPAGDAVLRRSLPESTAADWKQRIRSWSPYRSYAATRLWAAM